MRKIYLVEVFGVKTNTSKEFDFEWEINNPYWLAFKTLKKAKEYAIELKEIILKEFGERLKHFKRCDFNVDIYRVESEREIDTTYLYDLETAYNSTLIQRKPLLEVGK